MRLLIVEDEHKIANALKKGLEQESYAVDVAFTGTDGYDLAVGESYDAIVLDIMVPGMDGITICKKLRDGGNHVPIIMLTAKSQTQDIVTGLNTGADDYLPKPFAFEELLARLRALTRRPAQLADTVLSVADLTLDPVQFTVTRAGAAIALSPKEFALLEYLLRHKEKILSKDQLIAHVWNYDADILANTVEVYIGYLRKKIDAAFANKPPLIKTVRGFGYKIG